MTIMAPTFGAPFVRSSMEPLRAAAEKLARGQVTEGLEGLGPDRLKAGYEKGIDDVTRSLRLSREVVERAMPTDEVGALLQEVAHRQGVARRSVGQFVGALGSLVPPQTKPDTASQHLRAIAARYALDEHIAQPVGALAETVQRWEATIEQAGAALAEAPEIRQVVFRRRLLMAAGLGAVVAALAVVGAAFAWHHVVITGARDRIASAVENADPCAGEVDPKDMEYALPEQADAVARRGQQCAQNKERDAYVAACSAMADRAVAGQWDPNDARLAGPSRELLTRVASKGLTPKDLLVDASAMPCQDTPSGERFWKAYVTSATGSVALWGQADAMSDHVKSLLAGAGVSLSPEAKEALVSRVEADTKRAITKGLKPELDHARRLCALVDQLGYPKEPWCKAMDRIDKRAAASEP